MFFLPFVSPFLLSLVENGTHFVTETEGIVDGAKIELAAVWLRLAATEQRRSEVWVYDRDYNLILEADGT